MTKRSFDDMDTDFDENPNLMEPNKKINLNNFYSDNKDNKNKKLFDECVNIILEDFPFDELKKHIRHQFINEMKLRIKKTFPTECLFVDKIYLLLNTDIIKKMLEYESVMLSYIHNYMNDEGFHNIDKLHFMKYPKDNMLIVRFTWKNVEHPNFYFS